MKREEIKDVCVRPFTLSCITPLKVAMYLAADNNDKIRRLWKMVIEYADLNLKYLRISSIICPTTGVRERRRKGELKEGRGN